MGIDYGVEQLQAAVTILADDDRSLTERLQAVWDRHIQNLWSSVHLTEDLNERFKDIWARFTAPSDDPRATTLRAMTSQELAAAAAEVVTLAFDATAAHARGERAAPPPARQL
jgi:hypothetical protein